MKTLILRKKIHSYASAVYSFYSDGTYRCDHWSEDEYWQWSIDGGHVLFKLPKHMGGVWDKFGPCIDGFNLAKALSDGMAEYELLINNGSVAQ